ncbi:hypothetical protein [Lederbergia citrea]|uniref:hypothetical protein n=1 Tax=Lederbergia citrea TaxID=2833581 RepID=UPI001BC91C83|nr:hypothetical protein [Lederbergia citrea]MBS4204800.1 hypothetical protein [Lederbergia citrea]
MSITGTIITVAQSGFTSIEYKVIWILPLIYTLVYISFFQAIFRNRDIRITSIILAILLFLKAVLNPVLISLAGPDYIGKRYIPLSNDMISLSIYVSAYEIITVSFFVFILSIILKGDNQEEIKKEWKLKGSKLFYLIYVVFGILIYIAMGRSAQVISFFVLSINDGHVPIENTLLLLVRQIIVTAIIIAFLLVVNYSKLKYERTKSKIYINIAIIAAIVNIGIIVGDRRSVQIFTAILSIWILIKLYRLSMKKIVFSILLTTVIIFSLMTLFRWGAYSQGSYSAVLNETEFSIASLADYSQVYFGGPDSIATSLTFAENVGLDFKNLMFDFGRTIFGLNFLLRENMYLTSEMYNLFLYDGNQKNGQLIFGTSYGYIFFGFIGAPIIILLNTTISIILEKLFRKTSSYEFAYLFGYCLLRMALNLLTNTPTIMTVITQQLATLGLIIIVARIFAKKYNGFNNSNITNPISIR